MKIAGFLRKLPNVALSAALGSKPKFRLGDEVDDFIGREEITGIEIAES